MKSRRSLITSCLLFFALAFSIAAQTSKITAAQNIGIPIALFVGGTFAARGSITMLQHIKDDILGTLSQAILTALAGEMR